MKAYWIAHVDVTDPEQYQQYTQRAPAVFKAFGGRFLARGGRSEAMEGRPTPQRSVVIEFDSYEQAVACYRSELYQEACSHRQGVAKAEVIIVEGFEP
ncbi:MULTISPECIES: DUF1330 domain-containing protein [unclassified Pseudomonas]|uniref:DUF1330 domain-containing protein n=1 Tax=unclassified Pseudomonas TaxID=196821 RepID=UPI000D934A29|nr:MULTISPECIES: DUF1330 domain-containing protein [unclassified Pseudomonas]PYG75845.1 uncharacterized protein (DUF1330 family) [Pseudomonas sp. RV120224-01c]PYG79510.1 uncharacterized protein (DUF1330 family) [Pseudomonas sp. RV120224-01b]